MVLAIEINPTNFPSFVPAEITSVSIIMKIILPLLMIGAGLFFLIILLKAAFKILTAGDNEKTVEKEQSTIGFAVLGFIFVIISFLLVRIIGMILKVPLPF
mgnify:CR=1 FL=1